MSRSSSRDADAARTAIDPHTARLLQRYEAALEATHDGVWEWDTESGDNWWSDRMFELLEYDRTVEPSFDAHLERVHPDDAPGLLRRVERDLAGPDRTFETEYRLQVPSGATPVVQVRGYIDRDERGAPRRLVGVVSDVTQARAAEAALRASEERLRQVTDNIDEVFWLSSADSTEMIYVSPAYERIWQRSRQSLYDDPRRFLDTVHEHDRQRIRECLDRVNETGYDETFRIVRPDGSLVWIRSRSFPIPDASGQVVRVAGIAQDVSTEKQLEEQLLRARKLESIGRLAGGVAHDFNNLLTVVLSSTQLAARRLPASSPVQPDLRNVREAAERASGLTDQLLAFARRRIIEPALLDVNELTRRMEQMLRRSLGEHIELVTTLDPDIGAVRADPGQLEQLLVNLAVNARDAMPRGGKLTIETAAVDVDEAYARSHVSLRAGPHVMLAVSDEGSGIPREARDHIFEPFFTTKAQGTGLGLATCYGIVRQAEGHITVSSEPECGTRFEILLPHAGEADTAPAPQTRRSLPRRTETVLFVEDEPRVRKLGARILAEHGYHVLEAPDGRSALHMAESHPGPIHLLVTDVVMPGMDGKELAERLRRPRPAIKVLFTSGYANGAIGGPDLEAGDAAFLHKPYMPDTLLEEVQSLLESQENGSPGATSA